jgi:hypothetical protein
MSIKSCDSGLPWQGVMEGVELSSKSNQFPPSIFRQSQINTGNVSWSVLQDRVLPQEIIMHIPTINELRGSWDFTNTPHRLEPVFECTMHPLNHIVSPCATDSNVADKPGAPFGIPQRLVKPLLVRPQTIGDNLFGPMLNFTFSLPESPYSGGYTPVICKHGGNEKPSIGIYDFPQPFIFTITGDAGFVYVPLLTGVNCQAINILFSQSPILTNPTPDSSMVHIDLIEKPELPLNLTQAQALKVHIHGGIDNLGVNTHLNIAASVHERVSTILALVNLSAIFLPIFYNAFRLAVFTSHNILYGLGRYIYIYQEHGKSELHIHTTKYINYDLHN